MERIPGSKWSNNVCDNVVLGTFLCEGFRESNHSQFGCRVVGLSERSVETCSGCGIDDSSILLLSEDRPTSFGSLLFSYKLREHVTLYDPLTWTSQMRSQS